MRENKCRLYSRISLIFSVISSLPILFCIMNPQSDKDEKTLVFIASSVFWAGLIAEQVFIWMANFQRKKLSENKKSAYPGIISFFKTKPGKVSDIVLIVSVTVFIIMSAAKISVNVGQFILLFLIVLSFRFHCITNGKNYSYKSEKKKRGAKS